MNIAAVVTIYYPDEHVLHNMRSYTSKFSKTYLFDNTENVSFVKDNLSNDPSIAYFHDGNNNGIAKALNKAALMAIEEGYDWLLMMDQDSKFDAEGIGEYIKCVQEYGHFDEVAMFGVNDDENATNIAAHTEPLITDQLITSGTLLNLSLFRQIGPFDENLFIDAVDHDYAIRVLQKGFKMIQFRHIHLLHTIGKMEERASIKTFFLVKKLKQIHSPIRCYYMYRNALYLQHKYKNSEVAFIRALGKTVKATLWRNLFYGGNVAERIRYILLAGKDFRNNRMGKFG